MALIVQKYGGSSVATVEKLKNVARKIIADKQRGNRLVVVVSAMGRTTDGLIASAKEIHENPPDREMDLLLSTGEMVSVALLSMAIESFGEQAEGFPGYFAGIRTDGVHTRARIKKIEPRRILGELDKDKIVVIAGFQGMSDEETITTFGRGASDLTAIALAAALKADACEIYTDVEGVFTADPNRVAGARLIPELSYDEMLEMASTGAKVMMSRSVEFAKKYHVVFTVKSTFGQGAGTMVKEIDLKEGAVVSAVSLDEKQAKITVFHVPDRPGVSATIFGAIAKENINVDVIVQNVSHDNFADVSFTVGTTDLKKSLEIIEKIGADLGAETVSSDTEVAKLSVIGIGMMNHPGVAARMFKALAEQQINIEMISSSEIKISCVVRKKDGDKGLKAVHKEFIEKNRG